MSEPKKPFFDSNFGISINSNDVDDDFYPDDKISISILVRPLTTFINAFKNW